MPRTHKRTTDYTSPVTGEPAHDVAKYFQENYIVLQNLNFGWTQEDVERVRRLWRYNRSLDEIAAYVKRDSLEVFLLLVDLHRNYKLKAQKPPRTPNTQEWLQMQGVEV